MRCHKAALTKKIIRSMAVEKHITLTLSEEAMSTLTREALGNLQNGGRGIGNVVENLLINPLSAYTFDHEIFENCTLSIDRIIPGTPPTLECTKG